MRHTTMVLGGLLALLPAWGAAAQAWPPANASASAILQSVEAAGMLDLMQARGYSCSLEPGGSILWLLDDIKTRIFFAKDSLSIQFYAAFSSDGKDRMERVNAWNRDHRYSRSYIDREGDPCLELDLDLTGGLTEARIVDYLKTCKVSLSAWKQKVIDSEE